MGSSKKSDSKEDGPIDSVLKIDFALKKYVDSINNIPGLIVLSAERDIISIKFNKTMEESFEYFFVELLNIPGIISATSKVEGLSEFIWDIRFVYEPTMLDIILVTLSKHLSGLVYDQIPKDFYKREYSYERQASVRRK
mgnify:CR=1 FL=1